MSQLAHRAKAVIALIGVIATYLVATVPDSKAGNIAAAVLALLTVLGVHQTRNAPKPRKPVEPQKRV